MAEMLEIKQRIKLFFEKYEMYIMPVLKFILALVFFLWINSILGYSEIMSSIFVVLVLSLLCAILPINAIVYLGMFLVLGQCYAIGWEVAAMALILMLLMIILCLRFCSDVNITFVFTPLTLQLSVPAALPVGAGLLSNPLSAAPAACGVILFYFMRIVNDLAVSLQDEELELTDKFQLMLDGLVQNQEMWLTLAAFVLSTLLVCLLRTRAIKYAWRIAFGAGALAYTLIMAIGMIFLNVTIPVLTLLISLVLSIVFGFVVEFFAFGGDYSRVETLQFEDDDYFYYVRAVPKLVVNATERQIKKINPSPVQEQAQNAETMQVPESALEGDENDLPIEEPDESMEQVDYEKKLEESLKDL